MSLVVYVKDRQQGAAGIELGCMMTRLDYTWVMRDGAAHIFSLSPVLGDEALLPSHHDCRPPVHNFASFVHTFRTSIIRVSAELAR